MDIFDLNKKIALASGSPRRRELMRFIAGDFIVCGSDVDESCDCADPAEYVKTLAKRKASASAKVLPNCVVIGADTVVVFNGEILGKPRDAAEAEEMLSRLCGQSHIVYTGVAVIDGERALVDCCKTEVRIAPMAPELIKQYVETGEPMDKAGAYAVQGLFAPFIERVDGCYYNVMGLPLNTLMNMLRELSGLQR